MEIEIKNIRKQDYKAAKKFAAEGMNFTMFTENRIELYLYSKYFWDTEFSKASLALGAYLGKRFVGVILADMKGRPKISKSIWQKLYIKTVDLIMRAGYTGAADSYEAANKEMITKFKKKKKPDGEITFLAVDPALGGKGIGTKLLAELERREKGKLVYLYTDSGCTYQYYEHRGFERADHKRIKLTIHKKEIPLTCLLYSKTL